MQWISRIHYTKIEYSGSDLFKDSNRIMADSETGSMISSSRSRQNFQGALKKLRKSFTPLIIIVTCNGLSPLNSVTYAWNADSRMSAHIREWHTQLPDSPKANKARELRRRGYFTFVWILWPPLTEKQPSGLPLRCIPLKGGGEIRRL